MGDPVVRRGGRPAFKSIAAGAQARQAPRRREGPAARPLRSPSLAKTTPPRPAAPRKDRPVIEARAAGGGRRGPKLGLIILGAAVALAVALFLLLPSALRVRSVEVHGNLALGAEEVVAASLIVPGSALLSIDTRAVEAALAAWPPIESARVRRVLPDRIRIDLVERRPVVLAIAESEGGSLVVAIDAAGVSFPARSGQALTGQAPSGAAPSLLADVPVLSGIRFEGWKAGTRLPDFLLPTLASLATVEASDPGLLSLFSEIRVERSRYGELELLLFPLHHALPVRTGASLDPALLRSIVLVLDALSTRGIAGVDEIDFRTGTIVFRTKEGHSG